MSAPAGVAPSLEARARAPWQDDIEAPAPRTLDTVEREMIEQALLNARFNKSKAAQALGVTRHMLYIRMQKYGIR